LDSILLQSYGSENIELIISDDGSTDETVAIVNCWLEYRKREFYDVKFFASQVNHGISKNCNIAWKAATSEWIKTIAGDDILLDNCLDTYTDKVTELGGDVWFSSVILFDDKNKNTLLDKNKKLFSPKHQHKNLLIGNFMYAPSC
ncbi:glycosyltransferase family 2 protein, partial [Vibrio vulnificus]|nr:glycosyltransferase family 2 protein [Vibrio vulnificus]